MRWTHTGLLAVASAAVLIVSGHYTTAQQPPAQVQLALNTASKATRAVVQPDSMPDLTEQEASIRVGKGVMLGHAWGYLKLGNKVEETPRLCIAWHDGTNVYVTVRPVVTIAQLDLMNPSWQFECLTAAGSRFRVGTLSDLRLLKNGGMPWEDLLHLFSSGFANLSLEKPSRDKDKPPETPKTAPR